MVKQKSVKAKLQKKISSKKMIVETFIFMILNIYIFYLYEFFKIIRLKKFK